MLADMAVATDAALRAAARRLAGAGVPAARPGGPGQGARGTRRLGPSRGLEGDLDLDRTLDAWTPSASRRPGADDDIITRTWTAHRRAVCLVVDISGSMQGLAVALAAVAAAGVIVANEAGRAKLQPSALMFSAGVRMLQAQGVRRPPEDLLSDLAALRGHGTTDLAAGLREASKQLAAVVADERMVMLVPRPPPAHGGPRPSRRARGHRPVARPGAARRGGGRGGGGACWPRGAAAGRRRCGGWPTSALRWTRILGLTHPPTPGGDSLILMTASRAFRLSASRADRVGGADGSPSVGRVDRRRRVGGSPW